MAKHSSGSLGDQRVDEATAGLPAWFTAPLATAVYLVLLVSAAVVIQLASSIPASKEGSPFEFFTTGLLWMLSLVSLFSALRAASTRREVFFWLAASAALAILAIDEAFALHERSERSGIDDDIVKVVMWVAVPFVLVYLVRMVQASRLVRVAFAVGYVFHSLYIFVELGDGELFDLPFTIGKLKYAEELFELLFLSCYLYAFANCYLRTRSLAGGISATDEIVRRRPMD